MTKPLSNCDDFANGKTVDQETFLQSPSETSFVAPKGWWVSFSKDHWVLEDPERELVLTLRENREGDLIAEAEKAWKSFRPGFSREVKETLNFPGKDGWDEAVLVIYKSSSTEKRFVAARGKRKEKVWWFLLIDGPSAVADKLWAQVDLVTSSLKVPGVEPESFAGKKAHPLNRARLQALESFIEGARARHGVPGAAIAIVQDGHVVYEKGFGVREKGNQEPVTPSTLFAMASITKQCTTLMMARLVDKGFLDWETPVLKILPSFRLGDEELTKRLTLRHMVGASTGMPSHGGDLSAIFHLQDSSPDIELARMALMKPTTSFGEVFQYSNVMVAAGGLIAAHAAYPELPLGEAYDRAMKEEVLGPLGMIDSVLDWKVAVQKEHCTPHSDDPSGEILPVSFETEGKWLRVARVSGGLYSNVRDMANILLMETSGGLLPGGSRYLSEKNLLKRREPQVKITDTSSYGLGLEVGEDCGIKVISHDGGAMGFSTFLFFLPDVNVGAVILANGPGYYFEEQVQRRIMELLFDGQERAARDVVLLAQEVEKLRKNALTKVDFKPGVEWFQKLLGDYSNPDLGRVTIQAKGEGAEFCFPGLAWDLGRKVEEDGVEKAVNISPPWPAELELTLGQKDGRRILTLETAQEKYVFESVP